MPLQFPSNPTTGQSYQSGSSATYQWNGMLWATILPPSQTVLTATSTSFAQSASFATTASALIGSTPIYLSLTKTTTQSIPNDITTTVVNWATYVNNAPASWNSSTGTWTCPRTGIYDISFGIMLDTVAPTSLNREFTPMINHQFVGGGESNYETSYWALTTSETKTPTTIIRLVVPVTQGDIIRPRIYQNLRDATAVNIIQNRNHFIITELPNRIQK